MAISADVSRIRTPPDRSRESFPALSSRSSCRSRTGEWMARSPLRGSEAAPCACPSVRGGRPGAPCGRRGADRMAPVLESPVIFATSAASRSVSGSLMFRPMVVEFYHYGRKMLAAVLMLSLRSATPPAPAAAAGYLYRTTSFQAAPGKLLEVVDLYKAGWPGSKDSGDEPPIAMRHSQGDRWDLMLLFPMGSYAEYYAPERIAKREGARAAAAAALAKLQEDVAWQEDVFVLGLPLSGGSERARRGRLLPRRDVRGPSGKTARPLPAARDGERLLEAAGTAAESDLRARCGRALGSLHDRRLPGSEALRRGRGHCTGEDRTRPPEPRASTVRRRSGRT